MRKSWGRAVVIAVASVVIVSGLVFAVTARGGQGRGAQWLSAEQAPHPRPRPGRR